jgi:hypothetical protein
MEDVEAGLVGGLLLSAGGSGRNAVEKNRGLGCMALDYGVVRLVDLDELDPDAFIITVTAPATRSLFAISSLCSAFCDLPVRLLNNLSRYAFWSKDGVGRGRIEGAKANFLDSRNLWQIARALSASNRKHAQRNLSGR